MKRGCTEQRCWNSDGQIRNYRLADSDVLRKYVPQFASLDALETSLQSCVEIKAIERREEDSTSIIDIKNAVTVKSIRDLSIDGLMFLCYICPQEESLDPQ